MPGVAAARAASSGRAGRTLVERPAQIPIAVVLDRRRARWRPIVRRRFPPRCSSASSATRWPALFVVQGAPDLALTQVAIETLSTVLFVLVLRRLPDRFERRSTRADAGVVRIAIAVAVGAMVFVFAHRRRGQPRRRRRSPTRWSSGRCPTADGRNVVNVILVDFRGFDTLGEITVLAAAAIGAVALARAGRRRAGSGRHRTRRRRRGARDRPLTRLVDRSTSSVPRRSSTPCCVGVAVAARSPGTTSPAAGSSAGSSPARRSPALRRRRHRRGPRRSPRPAVDGPRRRPADRRR